MKTSRFRDLIENEKLEQTVLTQEADDMQTKSVSRMVQLEVMPYQ